MIDELRTSWREKHKASRLRSTRRALEDAAYDKDKWGWADTPSQREDRNERIYRLIRRYEKLGGDALQALPWGLRYMASDAMPEAFERRSDWNNDWETVRIGEEEEVA